MPHDLGFQERVDDPLKPLDGALLKVLLENHLAFRNFLKSRLSDEKEAEDLLQQSLVKALRQAGTLRDAERLLPWFYQILRNALVDHYRSKAADARKNERTAELGVPGGVSEEDTAALCRCLEGLLPALKPEYAELIRRIDLGEESTARVAADLGISENNLGVRLHRARGALKTSLTRVCGACTEHACLDCSCGGHGKSGDKRGV